MGCYIWVYADADPVESIREALALAERADLEVPILWLDVETYNGKPGPGVEWLRAATDEAAAHGVQAGIYSGLWYLSKFLPTYPEEFTDLPVWLAQYDGEPTLEDVRLPEGMPRGMVWGKQYAGDSPVDRNVFDELATQPRP